MSALLILAFVLTLTPLLFALSLGISFTINSAKTLRFMDKAGGFVLRALHL